jgi:hypothetical protein
VCVKEKKKWRLGCCFGSASAGGCGLVVNKKKREDREKREKFV